MSENTVSVAEFESAVKAKDYEKSCTLLLDILGQIDSNFGGLYNIDIDFPAQTQGLWQEQVKYFCTRMATAMTELFSDPNLNISEVGANRLFILQRWINMIFASSPYINADHVLQVYNVNPDKENHPEDFHLSQDLGALTKFCIMYLPESNLDVNLETIWQLSPRLCASLCYALQSPRFIASEQAFGKRANILQWFPSKLAQFENLDDLPSNISHDVYMHCSYDIASNKHDVKKAVNKVIRQDMLLRGWQDRDVSTIGSKNGKPIMVVVLEHFQSAHSIYRTHSTSMIAAKEHFYLIGIGGTNVDEAGRAVFDEFHVNDAYSVYERTFFVRQICEENQPAVLYMPSIGMDLTTIFVSNSCLAPIQAVALGHPATTHSDFIEYVIVEDDYVGSEDCFSETLLRLPKDALPYVPSSHAPENVEYLLRENPEVVQIGVASTTMKLNPYFLMACREIRDRAKVKVHFHFAMGQSSGVTHPYVERFLKFYLGDSVTAHPHQSYENYLRILYQCDMMINPFPFGNTNGIIDMITLGLVGVCKTGNEVHEHIDEGLFKRLGLPEWLITRNANEYIDCAVRLAENHEERLALRRYIIENNRLDTLFTGDPSPMGRVLLQKVQEWQAKQAKVVAPEEAKKATQSPAKNKKSAGKKGKKR